MRVLHFSCGCRMSVGDDGSAGNWTQDPARPHEHPGLPSIPGMFYRAVSHPPRNPPCPIPTFTGHDAEARRACDDPRCQKVARSVDRARSRRVA